MVCNGNSVTVCFYVLNGNYYIYFLVKGIQDIETLRSNGIEEKTALLKNFGTVNVNLNIVYVLMFDFVLGNNQGTTC